MRDAITLQALDEALETAVIGSPMPSGRNYLGIEVERLILHRETQEAASLWFCRQLLADLVALFRTGDTEVFAAADRCPHKGGPLSEGIVHGQSVTCPLHNMVFDLTTGQARGEAMQIQTHALRIEDGRVLIDGAKLRARSAA